jgi:hypothetical protein
LALLDQLIQSKVPVREQSNLVVAGVTGDVKRLLRYRLSNELVWVAMLQMFHMAFDVDKRPKLGTDGI